MSIEALGSGHIHDTYRVRLADTARGDLVFQRINTAVFPAAERLATNLERVTRALAASLTRRALDQPERRCLRLIEAPDGRTHLQDAAGRWWRAFPFIAASHASDAPAHPDQARAAGRAFGGFLADLSDLDASQLEETIPHFHDLGARLATLDATERELAPKAAREEADACRRLAEAFPARWESALPLRPVHNDCKFNNLLFDDATGEALCVVDLDTVMPGRALYDFGDLVRTASCTTPEDEPDPSRVGVDAPLFAALGEGFVAGTRGQLAPEEVASLAVAGPRMALENAVRFLTDHWQGDPYFRVHRPGQNLDRCRAQLALGHAFLTERSAAEDRFAALAREHAAG
ncbi:MAG: aminoglycoside phosphotransferase family protein [Myxococcota bacterium]